MSRARTVAATLVATLLSFTALAQAPESTVNGLKIGEGRLHPFFDLELRLDSAAGFFPRGLSTIVTEPTAEMVMHFRPGIRFELPGNSVLINLDAAVDYVWYTGVLSPGSQQASHLEAEANVQADFNKTGAVEFQLGDTFRRSDRTNNAALGVGVLSLYNEVRAAVPIHPGGGALEVAPGAAWAIEFFEPLSTYTVAGCPAGDPTCTASALSGMAYNNFHFDLDARWRFLPKTAVVLDTGFDVRTYADTARNPPAYLLRASLGLAGLLTSKFSIVAKLGWGHDFAPRPAGESTAKTLIAQAEVTYLMSDTSNIKVGYLRTLEPVPSFGVYGDDRGYAEGRFLFAGKLTLRANLSFDYLTFYDPPGALSGRNDQYFIGGLGVDYQFLRWLVGSAGYNLSVRASSVPTSSLNYPRHEGYLRLTVMY